MFKLAKAVKLKKMDKLTNLNKVVIKTFKQIKSSKLH